MNTFTKANIFKAIKTCSLKLSFERDNDSTYFFHPNLNANSLFSNIQKVDKSYTVMCVIKFNGTHTLQGFHEDDHRIVRRTCEFFCGYIVLAGQCQAPAAAIKSLYFYRLFDVPTNQSEGHLSRMRTSLLWTKFLFSDKIEKTFL